MAVRSPPQPDLLRRFTDDIGVDPPSVESAPHRSEVAWEYVHVAVDDHGRVAYGLVAFARAGPFERDTRGMASSIGVDERAIGAVVIAPALLDAYRYFRPGSAWAKWTSRIAKAGGVVLVLK